MRGTSNISMIKQHIVFLLLAIPFVSASVYPRWNVEFSSCKETEILAGGLGCKSVNLLAVDSCLSILPTDKYVILFRTNTNGNLQIDMVKDSDQGSGAAFFDTVLYFVALPAMSSKTDVQRFCVSAWWKTYSEYNTGDPLRLLLSPTASDYRDLTYDDTAATSRIDGNHENLSDPPEVSIVPFPVFDAQDHLDIHDNITTAKAFNPSPFQTYLYALEETGDKVGTMKSVRINKAQETSSTSTKSSGLETWEIYAISIGSGIFGIIVITIVVYSCRKLPSQNAMEPNILPFL